MARVELSPSRLRARKRRRRVRIGLFFGVLLLLLFGALVGVSYIPALQVREVVVSGTKTLASSTVQAFVQERLLGSYGYILPKSNIFLYPKQGISMQLLKAYPVLASADVHAGDFHTVVANVVERSPRALWCENKEQCFFIDENGVVYGAAPTFSEPVYYRYFGTTTGSVLPKQYLTAEQFQALMALCDALVPKVPNTTIESVEVDANGDVQVQFTNNFVLRFALADAGGDIFERFSLALTSEPMKSHQLSELEYLDLRFGDKLYYKLR